MEKIVIRGGRALNGAVSIGGMKNAALPVLFACILVKDKCVIENVPDVRDVAVTLDILSRMGAEVRRINKNSVRVDCTHLKGGTSDYELVRKIRASYYLLGAELGRFHRAHVGMPGGCNFGVRPIDQHIKGFEALGGRVDCGSGYVDVDATSSLCGSNIYFDVVSVGATINVMLSAVLAEGTTVIDNAAKEPHIVDVANFLNTCGADIRGAGTDMIKINGVESLHGCTYAIIPDMIEAGTFMACAAVAGGEVHIQNVIPKHLESISAKMREMNVQIEECDDSLIVRSDGCLSPISLKTLPYPGFPTDMHPQMSVLMCSASGISYVREGVFDNRFRYVEELSRMGAKIKVDGKTAIIEGGNPLSGAKVTSVDLRAGAALIIAGLVAEGKTEITEINRIERGYDNIVGKLKDLGADIRKVYVPDDASMDIAN